MGNCLNPASKEQHRRHGAMAPEEDIEEWCYTTPEAAVTATTIGHMLREEEAEEEVDEEETDATATAAAGVKLKVVLKRAELECLMAQLKTGDHRLEDVLHQMGTARALCAAPAAPPPPRDGVDRWRPRLERILECHEPAAT